MPRIDDCLDALRGAKWFSTLDLASGYWQMGVHPDDRDKTAFTCQSGLFQFKVLPFGLTNAPSSFERLMEKVLAGLQFDICLIYLDDVIVKSDDFDSHIVHLRSVFERIRKANLKLSPKKCVLFQQQVQFLGHVVTKDGIATDVKKVEAVQNWPVPKTVKEVRSFLGLCSYYRKFVKSFATIAKPLHQLSEKAQKFVWDQPCQDAFVRLKHLLTEAPILTYPDPNVEFILDTDASGTGIGAVLSQVQEGTERVIAYYSRVLSKAERNYCVTRRELLAIKDAVTHFHSYLYGVHFQIRTDHGSLRWLMNFKEPDGQLCRWSEIIGTYDYTITYRPGRVHGNADSLSRRPCGNCKYCNRVEVKNQKKLNNDASCQLNVLHSSNWFPERSSTDNRDLQLQDKNLAMLMDWKEKDNRPTWPEVSRFSRELKSLWSQWDRIVLVDGVLFRQWFDSGAKSAIHQFLVPEALRKDMFQSLHASISSGHLGIRKTIGKLRRRLYWVGYKSDILDWCRKCIPCQKRKPPAKTIRAPMKQYQVGEPMERIAIDILGPLPESHAGNKYIMITTDYFTRWTEAFPLPNQEALTIAKVLVNDFISRFGLPRQIHTDQGTQFESRLFQNLCSLLGIDKTRTTALHPQSDGMVERFNKTLEDMISKYITVDQRNWDASLQLLMMAY